jgi:hypothetical protein
MLSRKGDHGLAMNGHCPPIQITSASATDKQGSLVLRGTFVCGLRGSSFRRDVVGDEGLARLASPKSH